MIDLDESLNILMCLGCSVAGLAAAGCGLALLVAALRRRSTATDHRGRAGTAAVLAGAVCFVLLGVEVAGFSLYLLADEFLRVMPGLPDEVEVALGLTILLVPVGLVLGPSLTLWGTVQAWRVAEAAPPDAPPPVAGTAAVDPLDAPFAPGAGGGD